MLNPEKFPGNVHVMLMHSHRTQGVVSVAKSEKALLETYKEFYAKNPGADIRQYLIGRIIDLPRRHLNEYRDYVKNEAMRHLRIEVKCAWYEYFFSLKQCPPDTVRCSCLQDGVENASKDHRYDVAFGPTVEDHVDCNGMGFLLTHTTWDKLFEKRCKGWDQDIPTKYFNEEVDFDHTYMISTGWGQMGAEIRMLPLFSEFNGASATSIMFLLEGQSVTIPEVFRQVHKAATENKTHHEKIQHKVAMQSRARKKADTARNGLADIVSDKESLFSVIENSLDKFLADASND